MAGARRPDGLEAESVDPNAKHYSSWPAAPQGVSISDDGGIESRWRTEQARPR